MSKKDITSNTMHSADDLIVQDEMAKLGKTVTPALKAEQQSETEQTPDKKTTPELPESKTSDETESDEATQLGDESEPEDTQDQQQEESKETAAQENPPQDDIDEYGTKIGKKKLYTEEEVQQKIRERLSRGKYADENKNQAMQEATKDFTPDPESNESWETQLETFVEKTIQKISKKQSDMEWRKQEEQTQAEFEIKFTEGMSKYKDFQHIVAGKPITNAMMMATRGMGDPAAFLYAACKTQPKELARISEIRDPVTQATEIGRLEERMKRAKNLPSSPKPAKLITGDKSDALPQLDIDARISQHAKSKTVR